MDALSTNDRSVLSKTRSQLKPLPPRKALSLEKAIVLNTLRFRGFGFLNKLESLWFDDPLLFWSKMAWATNEELSNSFQIDPNLASDFVQQRDKHPVSDYLNACKGAGFSLVELGSSKYPKNLAHISGDRKSEVK